MSLGESGESSQRRHETNSRVVITLSGRGALAAKRLLASIAERLSNELEDSFCVVEVIEQGHDAGGGASHKDWFSTARRELLSRRMRRDYFPHAIMGEPAWDMLLALYLNLEGHGAEPVTGVAHRVGYPITTALRWLDYLEQSDLVERHPDRKDKRVILVRLTEVGRSTLEDFFEKMRSLG